MNQVIIGNLVATGKPVALDVEELIKGRLLIQATSGGGKSFMIRKILEETHGIVQQIIIDMEGDFVTLREHFDYLLAGKDGQIPAEPRSATLLARKVLELNANIIIDLSELSQPDRKKFVRLFLESLIETPKELWNRQCVVVLDEAHLFCPEKGHGESEATEAVNELMSRGRKRGLCGVLATQRPAKLNKDAASQCQNKLVGLASMDVDRKRSASELGFTSKEQEMSLTKIKHQFYGVGPAISSEVILIKAGPVKTKHLEPGKITSFKPVETAKAQAILEKLADLPQQAERELRTIADYVRVNAELKAENTRLKHHQQQQQQQQQQQPRTTIDPAMIQQAEQRGYLKGRQEEKQKSQAMRARLKKLEDGLKTISTLSENIGTVARNMEQIMSEGLKAETEQVPEIAEVPLLHIRPSSERSAGGSIITKDLMAPDRPADGEVKLGALEKDILYFVAVGAGEAMPRNQIALFTGRSASGGHFGNCLSRLKTLGLIEAGDGDTFRIKDSAGAAKILGARYLDKPLKQALEERVESLGSLPSEIYNTLKKVPGHEWTKEELGAAVGKSPEGGHLGNCISQLVTLRLAERADGKIRLNNSLA